MIVNVIKREIGDKILAVRLQKLRAASLILEAVEKDPKALVFAAIEYLEDVYVGGRTAYFEQNKQYKTDSSFTFNSREILKTLLSFLDIWVEWKLDTEDLFFGFYSTNNIGKEKETELSRSLSIKFPIKPVLKILVDKELGQNVELLESLRKILLNEYKVAYPDKRDGNLEILEDLTDKQWLTFFSLIDWRFSSEDSSELEEIVLDQIRSSQYYIESLPQDAEKILDEILALLEKRLKEAKPSRRYLYGSDVILIFKGAARNINEDVRKADPSFILWAGLERSDKRSIAEKLKDVCAVYDEKKIGIYSRKIGASRQLETTQDRNDFIAMKYRLYNECGSRLIDILKTVEPPLSEEKIDQILEELYSAGRRCVSELSKDFKYSFKSGVVIEGVVLELFDSCFLAFNT